MSRHQITSVRANIKTLCNAQAGLIASRVHRGMIDVDVDDDILQSLNSQFPASIAITGTTATATFADAPVFVVGQIITIDCLALEALSALYVGAQTITVVGALTIQWTIPTAAPATIVPVEGDLIFTTPMVVIRPAENPKTDGDTGVADAVVEVLIHFGLAADTDQNWDAIESLIYKLRDALVDQNNWNGVCCGVANLKIAVPKLLRKQKPFAGLYTLTLEFMGV